MKKQLTILLPILFGLTTTSPLLADTGNQLHEENCIACHAAMTGGDGSVLYTRKDRKAMSSSALNKQVNRCQTSLGLNWNTDQVNVVHDYLNTMFYHY